MTAWAPRITLPVICLGVSFCGNIKQGLAALRPLRRFRKPLADNIRVMSYYESQGVFELRPLTDFVSAGGLATLEGGFVERIGDEAIGVIVAAIAKAPNLYWISADHYMHGAICRYTSNHTAFALRRPGYCSRVFSAWREPAQADIATGWVRRVSEALDRFSGGALYFNYLTQSAGDKGVRVAYGPNLERLESLKSKYDPTNFYNSNRNIQPLRHAQAPSHGIEANELH
jgi:hypothetical protein